MPRMPCLSSFALGAALTITLAWSFAARPGSAAPDRDTDSELGAAAHDGRLEAHVFEMRTYFTAPGRLEVLHKRFREHTNYLFVKHGMTLVGYWTPLDKDGAPSKDELVYLLAYPSLDAREASWKAFMADPDWQKAWTDSKRDGPVVTKVESRFLTPTDFSPLR